MNEEPLTQPRVRGTCQCVKNHNPNYTEPDIHHVVPKSWGGDSSPTNLVVLCPTTHRNVHELLREFQHHGGLPPWDVRWRFSHYCRSLAIRAWDAIHPDLRPELPDPGDG